MEGRMVDNGKPPFEKERKICIGRIKLEVFDRNLEMGWCGEVGRRSDREGIALFVNRHHARFLLFRPPLCVCGWLAGTLKLGDGVGSAELGYTYCGLAASPFGAHFRRHVLMENLITELDWEADRLHWNELTILYWRCCPYS